MQVKIKKTWNVQEVADSVGRTAQTIRNHARAGRFGKVFDGYPYQFIWPDLVEYMGGDDRAREVFGNE